MPLGSFVAAMEGTEGAAGRAGAAGGVEAAGALRREGPATTDGTRLVAIPVRRAIMGRPVNVVPTVIVVNMASLQSSKTDTTINDGTT